MNVFSIQNGTYQCLCSLKYHSICQRSTAFILVGREIEVETEAYVLYDHLSFAIHPFIVSNGAIMSFAYQTY